MQLSELAKICNEAIEKYGDRRVVVDVEARHFEYHYADLDGAGMTMTADTYKDEPELLEDPQLGLFLVHLK
jgi:hypothetical protein